MNLTDWIVAGIIALLVILAILYSRKHKDCSGNCGSCHTSCSTHASNQSDDVPHFVRAYRKDHPKSSISPDQAK